MIPKIIVHNSISLDGSLFHFDVNMQLHYEIAGNFKPDAHLIGSNTITSGIELYGNLTKETEKDYVKPKRDKNLPYWIIPDTKGSLKGLLHEIRKFEFCKDIIILISKKTSKDYIKYLKNRNYDYFITGTQKIDLKKSLMTLNRKYHIKTILTDTGQILGNILINRGFVKNISLLIHPIIVGKKSYYIFNNINRSIVLKLEKNKILKDGYIWLIYKVEYDKK